MVEWTQKSALFSSYPCSVVKNKGTVQLTARGGLCILQEALPE